MRTPIIRNIIIAQFYQSYNFKKIKSAKLYTSIVLTFLIVWLTNLNVIGQISSVDGLPNNEVYCFAESNDGYIYVGYSGGLSRYDGSEFKEISVAKLKDNYILWMTSDPFGKYMG